MTKVSTHEASVSFIDRERVLREPLDEANSSGSDFNLQGTFTAFCFSIEQKRFLCVPLRHYSVKLNDLTLFFQVATLLLLHGYDMSRS